jgi:hypothetical protein
MHTKTTELGLLFYFIFCPVRSFFMMLYKVKHGFLVPSILQAIPMSLHFIIIHANRSCSSGSPHLPEAQLSGRLDLFASSTLAARGRHPSAQSVLAQVMFFTFILFLSFMIPFFSSFYF